MDPLTAQLTSLASHASIRESLLHAYEHPMVSGRGISLVDSHFTAHDGVILTRFIQSLSFFRAWIDVWYGSLYSQCEPHQLVSPLDIHHTSTTSYLANHTDNYKGTQLGSAEKTNACKKRIHINFINITFRYYSENRLKTIAKQIAQTECPKKNV